MNLIDKMGKWRQIVASLDVRSPPSRGALWTGLSASEARRIAEARNSCTLEMTAGGADLDRGGLQKQLEADFGTGWNNYKKQVWAWLSARFAGQLTGDVSIFVRSGALIPAEAKNLQELKAERARISGKILWDELMEADVASEVMRNASISKITVTEIGPEGVPNFVYIMPKSQAWN